MAYIKPTSEVYLLHGVPLSPDSEDTLYFSDTGTQANYFKQYAYSYDNSQYEKITFQRRNSGVVRVNLNESFLHQCNYLMFRNPRSYSSTAYSGNTYNAGGATDGTGHNKWYYAFVTQVDYVNENCSDVHYMIDNIQTYISTIRHGLQTTLVERQTVLDDAIGSHIEPEGIETGEYVYNTYGEIWSGLSTMCVCLLSTGGYFETQEGADPIVYEKRTSTNYDLATTPNGIPIPGTIAAFPLTSGGLKTFNQLIQGVVNENQEGTLYAFLAPAAMCREFTTNDDFTDFGIILDRTAPKTGGVLLQSIPSTVIPTAGTTGLDGDYIPSNNKLYTYPYCFYNVQSPQGQSLTLRYEFWKSNTPQLKLEPNITPPVTMIIRPYNYEGASGGDANQSLTLTNYPLVAWSASYFQQWLANSFAPSIVNAAFDIAGRYVGVPDYSGAQLTPRQNEQWQLFQQQRNFSNAGTVKNLLNDAYQASRHASVTGGSTSNGSGLAPNGMQTFMGGRMSITQAYANMIDDYFTKYGYKIMRVTIPLLTGRKHFMYVKTRGTTVAPTIISSTTNDGETVTTYYSAPAEALRDINARFNEGVRFWSPNYIYDYSSNDIS